MPERPPSIRLAGRGSLRSFGRGGVPIRARTHLVRPLLVLVAFTALGCSDNDGVSWIGFHGNALRTGWNPLETTLSPDVVQGGRFGKRWESPAFDAFDGIPGRAYASPLFVERVKVAGGPAVDAVFAATSNADVYAVSVETSRDAPAGTVLWKRHLGDPGNAIDGLRVGPH